MAKHRAAWNCQRYHKLIKEGRGQGTGKDYKPWITIHDFASQGVVSRVLGRTTGRIHHLFSRNETAFFYILDASEKVLDIREQYPLLPVTETVEIAEELGIRHPRDPASQYPYVMTSDFVITTPQGDVVRSVKQSTELEKPRVLEKLEIERHYWEKRNIEWRIVTEQQIDSQKAKNLEWIYRSWYYPEMIPEYLNTEEICSLFLDYYETTDRPVTEMQIAITPSTEDDEDAVILFDAINGSEKPIYIREPCVLKAVQKMAVLERNGVKLTQTIKGLAYPDEKVIIYDMGESVEAEVKPKGRKKKEL